MSRVLAWSWYYIIAPRTGMGAGVREGTLGVPVVRVRQTRPKFKRRNDLPDRESVEIAPAEGPLGVLIPGMGAVTTTFIAGVEAIKSGLAKPIGSVTQMATIRLGKRTEGRSPRIQDFVPLAKLDDLVFGGWDIDNDNCYEH